MWEQLRQETTRSQLIERILEEYEVDEATVSGDVDEFLSQLSEAGIITE